jgi:hypothetical protein
MRGLKFDANGDETALDFQRCLPIAMAAGYRHVYSVEYGGQDDPYEGIQLTLNEPVRYL